MSSVGLTIVDSHLLIWYALSLCLSVPLSCPLPANWMGWNTSAEFGTYIVYHDKLFPQTGRYLLSSDNNIEQCWIEHLDHWLVFPPIDIMLCINQESQQHCKQRTVVNASQQVYNALPVPSSSHPRANVAQTQLLIHFSQDRSLTQFHSLSNRQAPPSSPEKASDLNKSILDPSADNDTLVQTWDTEYAMVFQSQAMTPSHHHKCWATQWKTWHTKIIPVLINPWLVLQHETKSLHKPPPPPQAHVCTCQVRNAQVLYVKIICFFGKWDLLILWCIETMHSHQRNTSIEMWMLPSSHSASATRTISMCSHSLHLSCWYPYPGFFVSLVCACLTKPHSNCSGSQRLSRCTRI